MEREKKLGVIGGGFMAQAIVRGAIGKKFLAPQEIIVSEPDEKKRGEISSLGVAVCDDNLLAAKSSQFLLLAVKPQVFAEAAAGLRGTELPVVITIMAGKTKSKIREVLGDNVKVARVMPNLPCSVGQGVAAIDASELDEGERKFVFGLFSAVGTAVETEESLLNAVTGISGSGPAYVYLFLQSLIRAGMEQGLSEEQAKMLSLQTLKGGVGMVEAFPEKPVQELIDAVSSKGGTTVAALESFRGDDFAGCISRAVQAATKRAAELSK